MSKIQRREARWLDVISGELQSEFKSTKYATTCADIVLNLIRKADITTNIISNAADGKWLNMATDVKILTILVDELKSIWFAHDVEQLDCMRAQNAYYRSCSQMRASFELADQLLMGDNYDWLLVQGALRHSATIDGTLSCTVDNFDTRAIYTNREYMLRETAQTMSELGDAVHTAPFDYFRQKEDDSIEAIDVCNDVVDSTYDAMRLMLKSLGANDTEAFLLRFSYDKEQMRIYVDYPHRTVEPIFPIDLSPMNTYVTIH